MWVWHSVSGVHHTFGVHISEFTLKAAEDGEDNVAACVSFLRLCPR